ncbi:MAG: RluA family pseudouridine synthase [Spirochaetaceae bacterium]|jgi:23S rRNA pseudouridine955/2504/2580 synthase|nr:RluA family pseudouridine synthase [Spirochaetaceae bacterium]
MNEKPDAPTSSPVTPPALHAALPEPLEAKENDAGRRLDRILRKHFPAFPLSFINRLLREKKVRVNGKARDGAYRVASGDVITVTRAAQSPVPISPPVRPVAQREKPAPSGPALRIVYEDDDLLVVDKPMGLLTHGLLTHSNKDGEESLASRVSAYLADRIPASLSFRPGPLHRLDRNTSGLVVFGKSLKGARFFTHATQQGLVKKQYLALVCGTIEQEEVWEDFLVRDQETRKTRAARPGEPAKRAVTRIRPLEAGEGGTLIEAEISSGKTHQIRVQCALHGHPLCGDKKYGGAPRHGGSFLRAYKIVIETDGETRAWRASREWIMVNGKLKMIEGERPSSKESPFGANDPAFTPP